MCLFIIKVAFWREFNLAISQTLQIVYGLILALIFNRVALYSAPHFELDWQKFKINFYCAL